MLLQLDSVYAGYGGGDVLRGVVLTVEQGSITCIVGPNGAGKSTVMAAISGLLKPRQGNITFGGRSIRGLRPQQILARNNIRWAAGTLKTTSNAKGPSTRLAR